MNYRILGEPIIDGMRNYKGLYRKEPIPFSDSMLMEHWLWYASEAGDGGYIHDTEKAMDMIKQYQKQSLKYDLVKISEEPNGDAKNEFLGIDVAAEGGHSIIAAGLLYWNTLVPEKRSGIMDLLCKYFLPKMNSNLLLTETTDCQLLIRIITELESLGPNNRYVEPGYTYYPQFLYLVRI